MAQIKLTDIKLMRLKHSDNLGAWNLIRVDTDQGVWGLGEAYWGPGLRIVIDELIKPRLIGDNPLDIDRLVTTIRDPMGGINTQNGLVMTALSGIEIALWDLAGKLAGLPIYRFFGGKFRDQVRLYRTGAPEHPEDFSACEEYAARIKDAEGWTAIKAVGVAPHSPPHEYERLGRTLTLEDLRRIETVMKNMRRAFGEDYDIAVHCHWSLDLRDAQRLAERMAPYHPVWLEDPLPVPFSPAWVRLTETSSVPICMGENLYGKHEFRPFIEEHGTDIVHIDIPKAGGLLETRRIADMADTHYMKTAAHNPASVVGTIASVQVAATIRNFSMLERAGADYPWWEDLILHDEPIIRNGHIAVPEKPGLGIELNPDVVQRLLAEGEVYWGE
jgi:L-alanine-DL-glutamate epimerase-like enolase superfamily enzyme